MSKIKSTVIIIIFLISGLFSATKTLDSYGEEYSNQILERSLVAFAIARGLNGLISVVQDAEVAMQPAGVGLTLSPGEVLDPVNDLIERFSIVMLISASAVGVQKLLLNLSGWPLFSYGLSVYLLFLSVYLFIKNSKKQKTNPMLIKVSLFLIIVRFATPLMALGSEALYQGFLEKDYISASKDLEEITQKIEESEKNTTTNEQEDSIIERAKEWLDSSVNQLDLSAKIDSYKAAAEDASRNVIELITLFIVQTILFPIFFIWALLKIFNNMINRPSLIKIENLTKNTIQN